jgi:5-methylcytosine-specific restriction endonuclease McrA
MVAPVSGSEDSRFERSIRGAERPRRRDAAGHPLCRECGGLVRSPRRAFCSERCARSLAIRTSPSAAREGVFERDFGVCSACGVNTQELRERLRRLRRRRPTAEVVAHARELARGFEIAVEIREIRPVVRFLRTLWEADHVVPVAEGGGGCGLDNLRTLCIPCHRTATTHLAGRRARRRRKERTDAVRVFLGSD